jgi:hypothetical protein
MLEKRHEYYGIDRYKMEQLQFFFTINQNKYRYNLAYIEWFDIVAKVDSDMQMLIVTKMSKFSIIEVCNIIYNIYFIPFFDSQNLGKILKKSLNVYS